MGVAQTFYDWLGRRLNSDSVTAANAAVAGDVERVAWMELARQIGVSYVSSAVQACYFRFYGENGERDREAEWLWNVSPNINQSGSELKNAIVGQMFAKGESIVLPLRSRGSVQLLQASNWTPNDHQVGSADCFDAVSVNGKPTERVWYASQLYRFDLDATPGKRFTELQRLSQDAYNKLASSAQTAYLDGNVRRYKWKRRQSQTGTAEQQAENKAAMERAVRTFVSASAAAVWPEYEGNELMDFSQRSQTSNASQDFISIRKDMFETVAACMRMPLSMLYGNVNNFDQVFESFITFSILPVTDSIEVECTRKTYTPEQWRKGAHCYIDTAHIKHQDLYATAENIDKLIGDRVMNVNGVREDFGLDPIEEEWADQYTMTKNLEVVGGGN